MERLIFNLNKNVSVSADEAHSDASTEDDDDDDDAPLNYLQTNETLLLLLCWERAVKVNTVCLPASLFVCLSVSVCYQAGDMFAIESMLPLPLRDGH